MAAMAVIQHFDCEGKLIQIDNLFLPEYLDWMPIVAKVFWFVARGYGNPKTMNALISSQGEQRLVPIKHPLKEPENLATQERLEFEDDIARQVEGFLVKYQISRTPRNQ